jgi:hypothetical protein
MGEIKYKGSEQNAVQHLSFVKINAGMAKLCL